MYIEYFKIRESAPTPRRANPSDAGMDLPSGLKGQGQLLSSQEKVQSAELV
jgi:hypothetical protein